MLGEKSVLCSDIVIESDIGKRLDVGVGGRCGLSVAEEGSDNYVVLVRVQDFIFSYKPFVVGNGL